ncbi:MAG: hypothetical protein ACT4P5_17115 [Armatimonadota bacterium]
MKAWENPGKWHANPLNFSEEVTREFDTPERIFVLDSTLRKMTGTPGCHWTVEGAVEIAAASDEVGVGVVEVNVVHGNQPPSKKILDMFAAVATLKRRFKLFGTAWLTKESIDDVIDRGADGVNFTRGDRAKFLELYEYARSRGVEVAMTMGGRIEHMPPAEAARCINQMLERDIAYVGIHENTGATTPEVWRYYMKQLRKDLIKDVAIVPHIHNMLGQATAAACAAITGGAKGIDVTANGIAIHGGLAALEEVVASLEILYGVETGIRLEKLRAYSQVVSRASGIPVHPNKPLVGDHAFIVELDPFVRDVLRARLHGQERVHPIAPSLVGHRNVVVWGVNTVDETSATREKLLQMGLPHDDAEVKRINNAIRARLDAGTQYPLFLTEQEVEELARQVLAAAKSR